MQPTAIQLKKIENSILATNKNCNMKKSCDVLHEQDLPREYHCTKNGSFSFRISSINVTKSQFPVNLVTFTEEFRNGNFIFLCSVSKRYYFSQFR